MSDKAPETRMPVMIMVEAFWQDQNGTIQSTRARIENKSLGGACIRLSKQIAVGTKLRIEGRWEKFSGEARYCRKDGREYLVGIQRDSARTERPEAAKELAVKEMASKAAAEAVVEKIATAEKREEIRAEIPAKKPQLDTVPMERIVELAAAMAPSAAGRDVWSRENRRADLKGSVEELGKKEEFIQQPSTRKEAGKERKHMLRKWFDMGHKDEKQEGLNGIETDKEAAVNNTNPTRAHIEPLAAEPEKEEGSDAQVELLSMEDIYRLAGILAPRKGYSINKIVDMLQSEHLRGLSKEMKRASVLMALDAAGITVDEVLQDAKARQDAIDSYEAEQRKQFEAQLARKAEENVQIQAEMERVKARYTERLRRNLDGMAREKATFGNWLTLKQQEAQSMEEAVDVCSKAPAPQKPPAAPMDEVSLAGARVKPV